MNAREATHAGSWYPGVRDKLTKTLRGYLDEAKAPEGGHAKAIIVPHAGISYCGATEAAAFKYFDTSAKRVIIIGPSHRVGFRGCALTRYDVWETPIGDLDVDAEAVEALSTNPDVSWTKLPGNVEQAEHSLEMCTTWIALLAPKIKIVPIMVSIINFEESKSFAQALLPYFKDEETTFVISSDFCHWGERFDYTYLNKEWYDGNSIYKSISKLDHLGMEAIASLDPQRYKTYSQTYGNTICGKKCIYIMMHGIALSKRNFKAKFVHYSQSEQITSRHDSSVSYAAGIVQ